MRYGQLLGLLGMVGLAAAWRPALAAPLLDAARPLVEEPKPLVAASAPAIDPLAQSLRTALQQGHADVAFELGAEALLGGRAVTTVNGAQLLQRAPLAAVLWAQAAQQLGHMDAALPIYQALYERTAANGDKAVAARVAIRVGDLLCTVGHCDEALDWYQRAGSDDVLLRALLGRARALRLMGRPVDALRVVDDSAALTLPASQPLRPLLLAEGARAAAQSGQGERTVAYLAVLYTAHPDADLRYPGAVALAVDTDPLKLVPLATLRARVGAEGVVARAEALLAANQNSAVLATLAGEEGDPLRLGRSGGGRPDRPAASEEWPTPKLRCRAGFAQGKALRNLRRYQAAVQALAPVAKECGDEAPRALYLLGLVSSFQGNVEVALGTFERFAAAYPRHDFADDVLFLAGDLLTRKGRHAEAERYYLRAAEDYPKGDYRDEALWRVAWGAHLAGDDKRAREKLDAIARQSAAAPDLRAFQRAVYWRARLALTDHNEAAMADLDGLVRADPVSYYGILARSLLWRLQAKRAEAIDAFLVERAGSVAEAARTLPPPTLPDLPQLKLARAMLELGLDEEAREILLEIDDKPLDLPATVALAAELRRSGELHGAQWLLRTHAEGELMGLPDPADALLWQSGFPLAYDGLVQAWAQKRNLDPRLVVALMREESAFEAPVMSWAGAVGLMQLMPATALEEAAFEKLKGFDVATLVDPDTNIRLGTSHLARRLRGLGNHPALAVAAYNAGPGAVKSWIKVAPDTATDAYVETIPVEQTRNYTKRVLRSWTVYRFLYQPTQPFVDLPERVDANLAK